MSFFFTIFFLTLAAAVPGLLWLIFFLQEDVHPEPRKLILYTFGVGGLASIPVVVVQILGQGLILSTIPSIVLLVLFLGLTEEVFKFLSAYIAVGNHPELDEPIDFMIYMIAASLGLATVENFFILSDLISSNSAGILNQTGNILTLRFVGATFLHALASGFVGFYWAKSQTQDSNNLLLFGLAVATLLHAAFNYLVLIFQDSGFLIYPSLLLIAAGFVFFLDFEQLRHTSEEIEEGS